MLGGIIGGIQHNNLQTVFKSRPWYKLAAGARHTLLLTHDKKLYVCGCNRYGQLSDNLNGQNVIAYGFTPRSIEFLDKDEYITDIAAGQYYSLLLSNKGRLIGSGMNDMGQLGCKHQDTNNFFSITIDALEQGEHIVCIKAGFHHTVFLTNKGRLLGSGDNQYGQLGLPENRSYFGFEVISVNALKDNERIIKVVAGIYQTLLLTNQNRLLVTGRNEDTILGISHKDRGKPFIKDFEAVNIEGLEAEDSIIDMCISKCEVLLLTHRGQLHKFKNRFDDSFNVMSLLPLKEGEIINQIVSSQGGETTFMLTNQGRLLQLEYGTKNFVSLVSSWGLGNAFKPLDISFLAKDEIIIHMIAGDTHILLLTNKARVFGYGGNNYGQLGFSNKKDWIYEFQECDLTFKRYYTMTKKELEEQELMDSMLWCL